MCQTDPLGKTYTRAYDAAGNLVSQANRNGNVWIYAYDADNRRFAEMDPILDPSGYDLRQYAVEPMALGQYLYACKNKKLMDGTARARLINLIHLKEGNTYWVPKETLTSYFKNVWCEKDLPTVRNSFDYIWADSKNSKNVTNEFLEKVLFISRLLKCDPDDLIAAMSFETGGSFASDQKNYAGGAATGLIQFMPRTVEGLNTTIDELTSMSAVEQLSYVTKMHDRECWRIRKLSLSDIYMAILAPQAVGKPDSYAVYSKGGDAYSANSGLDLNKDGVITKFEATEMVRQQQARYKLK